MVLEASAGGGCVFGVYDGGVTCRDGSRPVLRNGEGNDVTGRILRTRRGSMLPRRETARVPSLHGWVETLRSEWFWRRWRAGDVCFWGDGGVICRDGS